MHSIKKFRPLDDDVALIRCDQEEVYGYTVIVNDDNDLEDFQYYDVVAKGKNVDSLNVGDRVVMSWAKMTPPIDFFEGKVAFTNQKEIIGVIER